jgi:hypothetical protein
MKKVITTICFVLSLMTQANDTVIFDLTKMVRTANYIEFPVSIASDGYINSLDFNIDFLDPDIEDITVVKYQQSLYLTQNVKNGNELLVGCYDMNDPLEKNKKLLGVRIMSDLDSFTVNSFKVVRGIMNGTISKRKVITAFCQGDTLTLVAPGSPQQCFWWSNGQTTQSIKVTAADEYFSFTITEDCTTAIEFTSSFIAVKQYMAPTAEITVNGPGTFCFNADSAILTAQAGEGYSFNWSTGETTQEIIADTTGVYTVEVSDTNNCKATSNPELITALPLPDASISIYGDTIFCSGDSVQLESSLYNGDYLWSTGDTTQSIVASSDGNYDVRVTDTNGCTNTSASIATTVLPLPDVSVSADGPANFCSGDSVSLTANSPDSIISYLWNTNDFTKTLTVYNSDDYFVEVTDTNGCVNVSELFTVTASYIPGDLNENGQVDATDLNLIIGNYGTNCTCPEDINNNGMIDASDLNIIIGNYGSFCN